MTVAVLSIGSNLGDRADQVRAAVADLGTAAGRLVAVSSGYQTPAWGDGDQPDYLNAVVIVADRGDDPYHWLRAAGRIERRLGRVRDPDRRFGPRTVDVDVVTVTAAAGTPVTSDAADLTLPHPRAHLRAFVLVPWLEIDPLAVLPGHGRVVDLVRVAPVVGDVASLRRCHDLVLAPDGGRPGPDRSDPPTGGV